MHYGPMSYYRLGASWPRKFLREPYPETQQRAARRRQLLVVVIAAPLEPEIPVNPHAGLQNGIVPLDPSIDRRTRQHTQIVAEVLNSLMAHGEIYRDDPTAGSWRIFAPASVVTNRAPLVTDDVDAGYMPGVIWLNQATNTVYICVRATAGSAVWFGPLM